MLLEQSFHTRKSFHELFEKLREKFPEIHWSLSESEVRGLHIVGRESHGLEIGLESSSAEFFVDIYVQSSDATLRAPAQELLTAVFSYLTHDEVPEMLYGICSSEQILALMTHQQIEGQFILQADASAFEMRVQDILIEIDTDELFRQAVFLESVDNAKAIWSCKKLPRQSVFFPLWGKMQTWNADICEAELKKELIPGHPLFDLKDSLSCIWQSGSSDDVLFHSRDDGRYVVVHLTWSQRAEKEGFPLWNFYASLEEFIVHELV